MEDLVIEPTFNLRWAVPADGVSPPVLEQEWKIFVGTDRIESVRFEWRPVPVFVQIGANGRTPAQ